MKKNLRFARSPAATATVILAGFLITLIANWPGHLSYDSVLQLHQGRTGLYNNWHPPVMAWLLGLGDSVVPGAGLFVAFDIALAFGALALLFAIRPARATGFSVLVALVVVLSPQLLLYQGLVWKDVLFADSATSGFACLAYAASRWATVRPRYSLLMASTLLLSLAALTRQNGMILLPFAAGGVGWIALRHGESRLKGALFGAVFFGATLIVAFASVSLLNLRSDTSSGLEEQLRLLQIYDIAGAVARQRDLPLHELADDDPELENLIRTRGAQLYTPQRNDPLAAAPDIDDALANADDDVVAAQWRALVFEHPWLYLRVRLAAFIWVFATPDIVACRPIFTGIEGPDAEMRGLGLAPRRDARDRALEAYGRVFLNTPIFSHVAFAASAIVCLVLLLRRRRPEDIAMAALLAGTLAFTLSFFVISIACDYRYLYALDLSALAVLLYLALDIESAVKGTS